ncbi:hypothetical protein [Halochromatium salexigens]|uniref:hypothetical protein n=1 Tax=Halochromatium salexigens TaxID=49447 RepID=UPI001F5C23E8|nr:hypothetical protein [Halochromatium salexigens]
MMHAKHHAKPPAMFHPRLALPYLALLLLALLLFSQALWGQGISARVDTPDERDEAAEEADHIPPFGANLFTGGFRTLRTAGLN